MPFQSEKQRRYMHANLPKIAQRWERDYAHGGFLDIKELSPSDNSSRLSTKFPLGDIISSSITILFSLNENDTTYLLLCL